MKGVLRASAMRGRVGQRLDDLLELDDRSGPAVRDDQREGVGVRGPLVNEVDVEPFDLRGELVEPIQRGFACPPVIPLGPVGGEFAGVAQRHALAPVVDAFWFGPACCGQPSTQVGQDVVGDGYGNGCTSYVLIMSLDVESLGCRGLIVGAPADLGVRQRHCDETRLLWRGCSGDHRSDVASSCPLDQAYCRGIAIVSLSSGPIS